MWGPVPLELTTGYETEVLPSTSQRALLCSLLRLRDTSKSPDQSIQCRNSTESSVDPGGTHQPRNEQMQLKDWVCLSSPWWEVRPVRRKGCPAYMQFIRDAMDHACPICRLFARSHGRKLQARTGRNFRILLGMAQGPFNTSPKFTYKYATPTRSTPELLSFLPE
jgi:hypothetical protein